MKTEKKQFKLIVEVNEKKLKLNYPNFALNYSNADQFINSIALGLTEKKLSKYGYNIIVEFPSLEDWKQGKYFPYPEEAKRVYNLEKRKALKDWAQLSS